jgi:hypothetical protein
LVQHILRPGDSYYFESTIPHRFRNIGEEQGRNHQRRIAADLLRALAPLRASAKHRSPKNGMPQT